MKAIAGRLAAILPFFLLLAVPDIAVAQYGGSTARSATGSPSTIDLARVQPGTPFNAATTGSVAAALRQASDFCKGLGQKEYVLDCLGYQYWEVQRQLPTEGDYAVVRREIQQAAGELETLARQNRSREQRPARLSAGGTARTSRPITPIARQNLSALGDQGAAIVGNAQVRLLRSASVSGGDQAQLRKIAQAMDSGALLLRSH